MNSCPLLAQSGHALLHCTCPLLTQSGHGNAQKPDPRKGELANRASGSTELFDDASNKVWCRGGRIGVFVL